MEAQLLQLLPHEGIALVLGPQGAGKTALAYRIAELNRGRRPVVAVGPDDLHQHIPPWILLVPSLEEAPARALVVYDEAHVMLSSRTAMTIGNRNAVHLAGFTRQRGQLLLVIAHHGSDLDRRLIQHVTAVLIKKPTAFAGMDRPALRHILTRASRAFSRAPGDPRRLVYVVSGNEEALAEIKLPSFWTDALSRAFATWTPQRSQDQEPPEREERSEEEAHRQNEEEREQAKAETLRRKLEERAITWYHRCLDDGLPARLAAQIRAKALKGWTAERLKKLHSVCHMLVSRGIEPEGLALFVATRPDELVIGHLRTLAGSLAMLRRWKIGSDTTTAFVRLFFAAPPEALAVLDRLDEEDPAWRSSSLASRVSRRLAALEDQARGRMLAQAITAFFADLRSPRPQKRPAAPKVPPRELVTITTPTGPAAAEVLARAGGQVLLRLPTGRVISLPQDGRARSPPARSLSFAPSQQHLPHTEDHT